MRETHRLRRLAWVAVVAALGALGTASLAAAQERRVAVVRLEFRGAATEVAQGSLSERLVEGLAAASFQVVAVPVAAQSCRDPDCYQEIARSLGVRFLITGLVGVEKKNYELALELLDGQSGLPLGSRSDRCELCGIREVGAKMEGLVKGLASFAAAAAPARARLVVDSSVPAVPVAVDGQERGRTPLEVELPPGEHQLALGPVSGARRFERSLKLEPGGRERIFVEWPSAPHRTPVGDVDPHQQWRRAGWIAVGVGALAVAAGVVALAVFDGRPLPESKCPADKFVDGACKVVTDARIEGGALLGGGGAALLLGGLSLYFATPAPAGATSQQTAGWFVGARGRF
jgi:TolB-like protein